jgi:hypothetical protein
MLDGSCLTNAVLASIAIGLQVLGRGQEGDDANAQKALWVIQNAVACLNHESDDTNESSSSSLDHPPNGPEQHDLAVRTVATVGTLILHGLQQHDRSVPLALVPNTFRAQLRHVHGESATAQKEIYCGSTSSTYRDSSGKCPRE